jgi:hypothetical protein
METSLLCGSFQMVRLLAHLVGATERMRLVARLRAKLALRALIDLQYPLFCNEQPNPGISTTGDSVQNLENLADRSYKTYKSRLIASQRLQARNRAWNACLLSLSVATTLASVALLTEPDMYGQAGATILVCVSIMALVASLVVAGLNYGGRSRDMFMNYRRIQRLSVEAEALKDNGEASVDAVNTLAERYESLLDDSENHTESDFMRALPNSALGPWPKRRAQLLTLAPYSAMLVPILVIWPILTWIASVA